MSITPEEAQRIQTAERAELIAQLEQLDWFVATDPALQAELRDLPLNHNGFLASLIARPTQVGNLTVVRLHSLPRGGFGLLPRFDVVNENGTAYTYEFFAWRHGPISGAKGLVLVRNADGDVTHVIVKHGVKFATAAEEYDLVGGFMDFGVEGVRTLVDQIVVEMRQELNAPDLVILEDDIHLMGQIATDPGMTNNRPYVFVAVISSSSAETISTLASHVDEFELSAGTVITPIAKLGELVDVNEDGFFGTVIVRTIRKGLIPVTVLVR